MKQYDSHSITSLVNQQKEFFYEGNTRPLAFRLEQLTQLGNMIRDNEARILQALKEDLNKADAEAYASEVGILLEELSFTMKKLEKWIKPKKAKTARTHIGSKGYVIPEPYGVTLIIAPWNYPFHLQISPLIGAIAAGNTAILKPSELTPATSALLAELIQHYFPASFVALVEGGVQETQELLKQPFDYLFFTGSVQVGKIVMEAAAKQLIPLTLELGGKSPCIIDGTSDIPLAAKRVAFGKLTNAGQTCVAPDYLFVHDSVKEQFIEEYKKVVQSFYGEHPIEEDRYGKIVNERHFDRLAAYLQDGEIIFGGSTNRGKCKIEPTLIIPSDMDKPLMQEEIFGPILPVLEYSDLEEVIKFIQARPKPLALYVFSKLESVQKSVTERLSFGGGCINDTLLHIATPHLPFGGVGESGMGQYHGQSSFDTFSHFKSILKQTTAFDFSMRYPSAKNGLAVIKKLMK